MEKYKITRNGLLGSEYSTKFSPWLAFGCISPRRIFHEIKKYETERVKNDSTYWVIFELLWRDYFRFIAGKYENCLFYSGGVKKLKYKWNEDLEKFQQWADGKTGVPFVDANMREMLQTGWMSNRGRQNVASFLTKDLKLDWRLGAEWFENLLVRCLTENCQWVSFYKSILHCRLTMTFVAITGIGIIPLASGTIREKTESST